VNVPTKKDKRNAKVRPHLLSYITMVDILHNHNHPIDCLHALTFRTMSEEMKKAYYQLFSCDNSATSAWHSFKTKLMIENKMKVLADRNINPSQQDVSRLFDKWREENLGSENGPKMFDMLNYYVKRYNLHNNKSGGCILVKRYCAMNDEVSSDDEVAVPPKKKQKCEAFKKETLMSVLICTPLMARVHGHIPQAREMMYVDSSLSMNRYNLLVFFFFVRQSLRRRTSTWNNGSIRQVSLHCERWPFTDAPKNAFYNAADGPSIIMTDDSES